jgi:peptidoglycan/LPS O-acetylase OafA/YrhL
MYPFFAGLLLSRLYKLSSIKNATLWSSTLLIIALCFSRIGGSTYLLTIIIEFPLIVFIGANGKINGKISTQIAHFLGEISYPLYIAHYVLIYIFTAWLPIIFR